MLTQTTITSFRNLAINEELENPFSLMPGIDITNSEADKIRLINDDVISMIGIIETDHIFKSSNLVFCEFDEDDIRGGKLEPFLLAVLLWIKGLFRSAWVLQDHCFECDAAYLFSYEDNQLIECTSNFLAQRTTLADCSTRETTLDMEALKKWHDMEMTIGNYLHENESSQLRFLMEKGFCRAGRAFQYIDNARNSTNMGFKVAHYISAFEALFSTSSAELSHKLSERVAFFLGKYGFNKKKVYSDIRDAYDVRSKLVHGDSLSSNKIKKITEISSNCDGYIRHIMQLLFRENEILSIFEAPQGELEEYFNNLIRT